MEDTQTKAALGARPRKQLDAFEAFSLAVKPDVKSKSLVEILEELPDFELMQLERYASMIIKTASLFSGSYYQRTNRIPVRMNICLIVYRLKRFKLMMIW